MQFFVRLVSQCQCKLHETLSNATYLATAENVVTQVIETIAGSITRFSFRKLFQPTFRFVAQCDDATSAACLPARCETLHGKLHCVTSPLVRFFSPNQKWEITDMKVFAHTNLSYSLFIYLKSVPTNPVCRPVTLFNFLLHSAVSIKLKDSINCQLFLTHWR